MHLLTEIVFTFLVALMFHRFVVYADRPLLRNALATGLCLGLAALSRDVILPLALPAALLIARPARVGWGRTIVHVFAEGRPGAEWDPVEAGLADVYFSTLKHRGLRRAA